MKNHNHPTNYNISSSCDESQVSVKVQQQNLDELDHNLIKERTSTWFATFVKNTNQKRITVMAFDFLINKINEKSCHITPRVLDIGFGEGELSSRIAQTLVNIYPSLVYSGIEYDNKFVVLTKNKLTNSGINDSELICGNCFNDDLKKLSGNAGLVLASHIAYYAPNMDRFIESLTQRTATNGIAVFLHESANSDMNKLRYKYCNSINTSSNTEIMKSLTKLEVPFHTIELNARLTFPENMPELWNELNKCNYEKSSYRPLKNFELAKNLLEFVAQTPLESLHAKGQLQSYLDEVKTILINQGNMLIIRTEMQLAVPKESSKEFIKGISSIAQEMQAYVSPLTKINNAQVIITNINNVQRSV